MLIECRGATATEALRTAVLLRKAIHATMADRHLDAADGLIRSDRETNWYGNPEPIAAARDLFHALMPNADYREHVARVKAARERSRAQAALDRLAADQDHVTRTPAAPQGVAFPPSDDTRQERDSHHDEAES